MPENNNITVVAVGSLQKYHIWQRLEPDSRSDNFQNSLEARISDPLWMLTRQWQMGEFKAEDAGSPVKTILQTSKSIISKMKAKEYDANGDVMLFDNLIPLEKQIEQEPLEIDLKTSVEIGQYLADKLIENVGIDDVVEKFKNAWSFTPLTENEKLETEHDTIEFVEFFAGNVIDGKKVVIEYMMVESPTLPEEITTGLEPVTISKIEETLLDVKEWIQQAFGELFLPVSETWNHSRFEYENCISANLAGNEQCVLEMPEYDGNYLDWSDFNIVKANGAALNLQSGFVDTSAVSIDPDRINIPVNVTFNGMPDSRWWAFENAKTNFGDMSVKTTDLGKLLLMEFALVYGNDWYQIPVPMKSGSLCRVNSLQVMDVFGLMHQINKSGTGQGEEWQRFEMFTLSHKHDKVENQTHDSFESGNFLFLPPVLPSIEKSPVLEEIMLFRDEMANKVWAIEKQFIGKLKNNIHGNTYYIDKNNKLLELNLKEKFALLELMYNIKIPGSLDEMQAGIETFELTNSYPELNQVLTYVTNLSNAIRANSEVEELIQITFQLQNWYNQLEEIIDSVGLLADKSVLNQIISSTKNTTKNLVICIKDLREFSVARSVELKETCIERIIEALKEIIPIELLNEDEKSLLEISSQSADNKLPDKYKLMNSVPEYWIPYIPKNTTNNYRKIQLVQAAMIRTGNETPELIGPKSNILKAAYANNNQHSIHEETVARNGKKLQLFAQRCRWYDGSTHVWYGRKVSSGKGEGSSGLKFDYIENTGRNKNI